MLTVLISTGYALAQPDCPCDEVALENGLTVDDIVEVVCPAGTLDSESEFFFSSDVVYITLADFPYSDYDVELSESGPICEINLDGPLPVDLKL